MFTRVYRPIAIAVVISMVLLVAVVTPVGAETQPATNRDAAGAPPPDWILLEPGATHWYKFIYDYDDSDEPPQALVVVKMDMPDAVSFAVETPGSLAQPRYDEDGNVHNPVGVGSPVYGEIHKHEGYDKEQVAAEQESADEHDRVVDHVQLLWAGSAKATDTYYVIVTNNHDHPCAYKIDISGKTVSY
jgi:hypothetical protein